MEIKVNLTRDSANSDPSDQSLSLFRTVRGNVCMLLSGCDREITVDGDDLRTAVWALAPKPTWREE